MTIVTLILSSGDMSLCPDDRGRPHDDRDKSGTQIDVRSTLIVSPPNHRLSAQLSSVKINYWLITWVFTALRA